MGLSQAVISGEAILYYGRPHWIVPAGPMMLAVFCVLPGLVELAVWLVMEDTLKPSPTGFVSLVALGAAGLLCLASLLSYLGESFVITHRRLILQQGVVRRKRMEILLAEIGSIDIVEDLAGEILGYGSIVVHRPDGSAERFTHIPDPVEFREKILEQRARLINPFHEASAA
jgi:uncharacterized membrane protein YdbT with pleckstrin-like domain